MLQNMARAHLGREVIHEKTARPSLIKSCRRLAEKRVHTELEIELGGGDLREILHDGVSGVPTPATRE